MSHTCIHANVLMSASVLIGGPKVQVGWYSDGRVLESRAEYQIHDVYFYHLQLRGLSRNQHGKTYTCQASLDVVPPIAPVGRNITLSIRRQSKLHSINYLLEYHFLFL